MVCQYCVMKNNKLKNKPLVSIIMPVKNAGKFVGAALQSIIDQTYKNWEMIVVDDGSSDKTGSILKKFANRDKRITVIVHKRSKGIGASLNLALTKTKGRFIARMDGDDIALPNRLEVQVSFLQKHRQIVAVGGQTEMIDAQGEIFAFKHFPTEAKKLREMIMWMVPIQHPIMMARATAYKQSRYDESFVTAEDVGMFMQLLQYGEFGNVPEVVYQYRKADTSNGYHNLKQTFYLTLLGRWQGVAKFGYRPSVRGIAMSLIQLIIVSLLPAKLIVRLYESRRFLWLVQQRLVQKLSRARE
jgi:glycosyltransferase involved in cell wall biosynthesis